MFKNVSLPKIKFLNILIWSLPFSIILGNLFINLNSLLIIFSGLYILRNHLLKFVKNYINYIVLFLIFIFINILFSLDLTLSLKGFFGLIKNILISLILYFWLKDENSNLKSILISILLSQIILIISLFLNLSYLFINTSLNYNDRIGGLFFDESVAGSYIIKLLIPSILFFLIYLKNNKYLILFILVSFISILVTGDRAPAFLFIITLIFFIVLNKKIKFIDNIKILFTFSLIILIFFISSSDFRNKVFYTSGQLGLKNIEKKIYNIQKNLFKEKVDDYSKWVENEKQQGQRNLGFTKTDWFKHYDKAIEIGKQNFLFGSGIKTFRKACRDPQYNIKFLKNRNPDYGCSTHPHNIYIEIFSETGIFGLLVFLSLIFILIIKSAKNNNYHLRNFIYCYIIILFIPIQTTGSFFSTFNGIFYFICLSLVLYLNNQQKLIK